MSYPTAPRRAYQIDVIDQVGRAYRMVFDHARLVMGLALMPYLWVLAAQIIALLLQGQRFGIQGLVVLLSSIVQFIFTITFAVLWYRFILLGETGGSTLIPVGWKESVIVAIKLALVYCGLFFVAWIPIFITGLFLSFSTLLIVSLVIIAGVLIFLLGLRVSLVFPAAAIQQPVSLRIAWGWVAGNCWRFFACLFACNLPFAIVGYLVSKSGLALPSPLRVVFTAFWLLVSFAGSAVNVALLAHLYRDMRPGPFNRPSDGPLQPAH